MEKLLREIRERRLHLTVLGSGYVGLTTAAIFADAGFHVTAVDVKPDIVTSLNKGISAVNEPGLEEIVSRNAKAGTLRATLDSDEALAKADVVIISVQTPINQTKKPDLSFLVKALKSVGRKTRKNTLVVVSSTVPPRTIAMKVREELESISSLRADVDFYLAYAPERIAPGRALAEFADSPKLVGGIGPNSTRVASELFRAVCRNVLETDASTAEVAKLAENTFRDVNIALANQLALICEKTGVDVIEAIKLANTHPRVNIHNPGPGVGGPCLPKDPYLLLYATHLVGPNLIKTARQVNDSMPRHIENLVLQALRDSGKATKRARITVLGTSYKADVDDSRGSPAEPIIRGLISKGFEVLVYDPGCDEAFGARIASSISKAVEGSDCLVVVTPHKEFRNLDLKKLKALMNRAILIDGARVIDPGKAKDHGFSYFGTGFGRK